MIRFRLVDRARSTSRLFEFDQDNLRIGGSGCDLTIPGWPAEGGDLKATLDPSGGLTLDPGRAGGDFRVAGVTVSGPTNLQVGGTIEAGASRVELLDARPRSDRDEDGGSDEDQPTSFLEGGPISAMTDTSHGGAAPEGKRKPQAPSSTAKAATKAQSPSPAASTDYLALFFGPVAGFLDDEDVSEVMINGPDQIYVERKGRLEKTDARFLNDAALQAAVRNVARYVGRRFDELEPRLDARLPDGSRVHAVSPPLCRRGTVVAIRKFSKEKLTIERLMEYGSISPEGARFIDTIVKLAKNIIISGPTSSGKTSVLNVLSRSIPDNQRILVIEDASELQLQQEHLVQMETRKPDEHGKGEVTIRDLVHSSLRLRPDRLVIGEIRGGEALDLLQAMNTGHSGSMSTIHANGPIDALRRLETCALLSGIDIPLSALREQVCGAINIVIHTARLADGSRKITKISEVLGMEAGEYLVNDLIVFHVDQVGEDGKLIGRHVGTGNLPTFMEDARMRRMDIEPAWFEAPGE